MSRFSCMVHTSCSCMVHTSCAIVWFTPRVQVYGSHLVCRCMFHTSRAVVDLFERKLDVYPIALPVSHSPVSRHQLTM